MNDHVSMNAASGALSNAPEWPANDDSAGRHDPDMLHGHWKDLEPPASAAVSSAPTSVSTTTVPSTAGATAALGFRARFIDSKRLAHELLAVQRLDGGLSLGLLRHFHESESL